MVKAARANNRLMYITTVQDSLILLEGRVRFMREMGLDVMVLSGDGPNLQRLSMDEGCDVAAVPFERKVSPLQDLVSLVAVIKCMRSFRPTIVHTMTPKAGLLGTIAARMTGVPVIVYDIFGLPHMTARGAKRWVLKGSERVACTLAHQVYAVSESMRRVAVRDRLCKPGKVRLFLNGSANGVDGDGFLNPNKLAVKVPSVCSGLGLSSDDMVITFVGRLTIDKGVRELVSAWESLRKEYRNATLLVVGSTDDREPLPKSILDQLHSDQRIITLGLVSRRRVAELYACTDILVLPTYREGFPNVLLEAAAMELPVVATGVPGCCDAVLNGETGTLVPPRDSAALRHAIKRYLDDPQLRRRHGRAGRSRVLRDFRQEAIWRAMQQEYVRLLREKGLAMSREQKEGMLK